LEEKIAGPDEKGVFCWVFKMVPVDRTAAQANEEKVGGPRNKSEALMTWGKTKHVAGVQNGNT